MLDSKKVFLGIAPIGWTNDDMPELGAENTFQQCVSEMALAGFSGTEIGNKYPSDASTLKHMLDVRGLRIASRWFSSFLISKPLEENVKAFEAELAFLAAVGAKAINVSEQSYSVQGMEKTPIFGHKYVMNEQEWGLLTNGLNVLGKIAAEKGFRLCFHHHMGTVVQTAEETTRMLDETDAKYVHLCYDTGHFVFTGADPVAMLKKYVNRVGHVHLKDVRLPVLERVHKENLSFLTAVREGAFTVPGDGGFDFQPVFDVLDKANYTGWLLVEAEQDPAKANPFEYAKMARSYIAAHTGL
ncbi:Inosose dehydratase [bioreactor metagenome]|jgi:inosose dehydratase|uniref:Inosose dehydratase n=1 Tax=bioreactor metagenome TaxID=1076179 RepID=A0A644WQD0_9ZZZZ